jgi:hypothetical protein
VVARSGKKTNVVKPTLKSSTQEQVEEENEVIESTSVTYVGTDVISISQV